MEEIVYLKASDLIPNTLVRADVEGQSAQHKLRSLAHSIAQRGIQTPLVVVPRDQGYVIVDGNRRYAAGQRAGLTRFPCVIRAGGEEPAAAVTEMGFSANELRQDLSPSQEFAALERVAERGRFSLKQISDATGKSYSQLKKIHQRGSLAASVLERMDQRKMSQSAAIELAPLPPDEQEIAVEALEEMGLKPTVENVRLYRGGEVLPESPRPKRTPVEESLGTAAQELEHLQQIYRDLEQEIGWAHAMVVGIWRSAPLRGYIECTYPEMAKDFETVLEVLGR